MSLGEQVSTSVFLQESESLQLRSPIAARPRFVRDFLPTPPLLTSTRSSIQNIHNRVQEIARRRHANIPNANIPNANIPNANIPNANNRNRGAGGGLIFRGEDFVPPGLYDAPYDVRSPSSLQAREIDSGLDLNPWVDEHFHHSNPFSLTADVQHRPIYDYLLRRSQQRDLQEQRVLQVQQDQQRRVLQEQQDQQRRVLQEQQQQQRQFNNNIAVSTGVPSDSTTYLPPGRVSVHGRPRVRHRRLAGPPAANPASAQPNERHDRFGRTLEFERRRLVEHLQALRSSRAGLVRSSSESNIGNLGSRRFVPMPASGVPTSANRGYAFEFAEASRNVGGSSTEPLTCAERLARELTQESHARNGGSGGQAGQPIPTVPSNNDSSRPSTLSQSLLLPPFRRPSEHQQLLRRPNRHFPVQVEAEPAAPTPSVTDAADTAAAAVAIDAVTAYVAEYDAATTAAADTDFNNNVNNTTENAAVPPPLAETAGTTITTTITDVTNDHQQNPLLVSETRSLVQGRGREEEEPMLTNRYRREEEATSRRGVMSSLKRSSEPHSSLSTTEKRRKDNDNNNNGDVGSVISIVFVTLFGHEVI